MNPENVTKLDLDIDPGATPEEVQKAVQDAVAKLTGPEGNQPPMEVVVPNPYQDRFFKPDEKYPGKKRAIILYPDARLEQTAPEEGHFGDGLNRLAADLVATAKATDAAGLAAIQIGVNARIVVVRISKPDREFIVLVNPVVRPIFVDGVKQQTDWVTEGCLSFPGIVEKVLRWKEVLVQYQDLSGEFQTIELKVDDAATGVAAQAVQHEVEHLDGKLLLANLSSIHRDRLRMHMKKVHRRLEAIEKKTRGKLDPMQAVFGYIPDKDEPTFKVPEVSVGAITEATQSVEQP